MARYTVAIHFRLHVVMTADYFESVVAEAPSLDDAAVAKLAQRLATSGAALQPDGDTADLASTGGPSSLSTLVGPLYLRAYGFIVPKLGVPGRPAGGIDVLAQIPGFRTDFSIAEIQRILRESGYAHFAAGGTFAPADAQLFALRQKRNAQAVPSLVIASLLSKKLAVGVRHAGFDIRVARHGNFGPDFATARLNARRFTRVAAMLDIRATCFLTPAEDPYQPYIGRSEAVLALARIFESEEDGWLAEHHGHCRTMAAAVAGSQRVREIAAGDLRDVFENHLRAQSSSLKAFIDHARATAAAHTMSIRAASDGFAGIDLDGVRTALVNAQRAVSADARYPDPAGVILRIRPGTFVRRDTELASVRGADARVLEELSRSIASRPIPQSHAIDTVT